MKITDYLLLEGDDLADLQGLVRHAISEGWQPLGGVAVSVYTWTDRDGYENRVFSYVQALVRYEEGGSIAF
jgi:hypothetical protein